MKKIILALVTLIAAFAMVATPVFAVDDICNDPGAKNLPNYDTLCGGGNEGTLLDAVKSILSTVFIWMGIIAVIVIIIGGVKYMTSQGDPGKVKSAKDTILYAVIGLVVALLAYAIVNFVLRAVS